MNGNSLPTHFKGQTSGLVIKRTDDDSTDKSGAASERIPQHLLIVLVILTLFPVK